MKYIALLRGINISGKNKIPMASLKEGFEDIGYINVVTYLNSGNVVFTSDDEREKIVDTISLMIKEKFDLDIPVYVITSSELSDVLNNSPVWWGTDNKEIYDNIIFIIPPVTFDDVYKEIGEPSSKLEQIENYKNTVFWSFDLKKYQKCNWWVKTASVDICNKITIRTANTVRKVLELCNKDK